MVHEAIALAAEPHRGPVFLDFPLDVFGPSAGDVPAVDAGAPARRGARSGRRRRARPRSSPAPSGRRSSSAATSTGPAPRTSWRPPSSTCGCRCSRTGSGAARCRPTTSWRSCARAALLKTRADVVVVLGTPLDFRLGFGRFGDATVAHVVDAESQRAAHVDVLTVAGDIAATLRALADHTGRAGRPRGVDRRAARRRGGGAGGRGAAARRVRRADQADADLRRAAQAAGRATPSSICDGGDFASYAGKYVEVFEPGCWLDTGPVRLPRQRDGLLDGGAGRPPRRPGRHAARRRRGRVQPDGRRLARAPGPARRDGRRQQRHVGPGEAPDAGDLRLGRGVRPAARLPLRRGRARRSAAAASWSPTPSEIGPALDRAFASGVPYVVNVVTDPTDVYPRSSNLG